jgi:cellulose 1,4-beta-cellobiosidase
MDILEANNAATTFTPHPCNITGVYPCTGALCGSTNKLDSVCDKDGCEINPYRNGVRSFFGKGSSKSVDTSLPFTVITQFLSEKNSNDGSLTEIRRLYKQNGKLIPEPPATAPGLGKVNSITDSYCATQKSLFGGSNAPNAFKAQGGMKQMGEALQRGMVLAMSIWHDAGGSMHWLDSVVPETADPESPGAARGSCPVSGGKPSQIQKEQPDAVVQFSKIRIGEIGSTYS